MSRTINRRCEDIAKREWMNTGDPYQNLANFVVIKAAEDYEKALREKSKLKHLLATMTYDPHRYEEKLKNAQNMIDDCEHFFTGRWIELLTDLDGAVLMNRIRKQCKESEPENFVSGKNAL